MPHRTLILHIGGHKTGSTSIQAFLNKEKSRLYRAGYTYFTAHHPRSKKSAQAMRPHGWVRRDPNTSLKKSGYIISSQLALALKKAEGNVIFSCEGMSWVFDELEIQKFHSALREEFQSIKVIVYIRRQDLHAVSHHQQGSKASSSAASNFFGKQNDALPKYKKHFDNYLDYDLRLKKWANHFGKNNLFIRVFEIDKLINNDVVSDFVKTLDLPITPEKLVKNESLGKEEVKLGHLANKIKLDLRDHTKLKATLPNSGKMLPSKEEAKIFYEKFKEKNSALNSYFNIASTPTLFSESFDSYPEKATDTWTEESANQVILALLKEVKRLKRKANTNKPRFTLTALKRLLTRCFSSLRITR